MRKWYVLLIDLTWILLVVLATRGMARPRAQAPVIDCRGDKIGVLVRDYDRRLWRIDVCAVAQSDQDGSEFKTEVKE